MVGITDGGCYHRLIDHNGGRFLRGNFGVTTVIEIMCTQELGDPFRKDALSKPVRYLDKYKDYV